MSASRRSRAFPASPQSTSQKATIFCDAKLIRFARPMPPTPMPAMLSLSLGGTNPRPRTWRGTMVTAAAAAACERNFLRGIALLALMDQLRAQLRQKEYHEPCNFRLSLKPGRLRNVLFCFSYQLRCDYPHQLPIRWRKPL